MLGLTYMRLCSLVSAPMDVDTRQSCRADCDISAPMDVDRQPLCSDGCGHAQASYVCVLRLVRPRSVDVLATTGLHPVSVIDVIATVAEHTFSPVELMCVTALLTYSPSNNTLSCP